MKIRDKLFLGFGFYLLFAIVFGALAYKDLNTISTHLQHLEIADDVTNNLLEVRRYEKNYLLYGDSGSLEEIGKYLAVMKESIAKIQDEAARNIGDQHVLQMMKAIDAYEERIGRLGEIRSAQERLRRGMRSGPADRLLALQGEEKTEVEQLRMVAREVQVYVEENARAERTDIARILKVSSILLVITLGMIIVLGTVINSKLARSIVNPIQDLERITKKIARGDFSESIKVKGHDEIAALAESFNQMEDKLDQAMTALDEIIKQLREKQSQLVEAEKLAGIGKLAAGIAHEINNPLTSVLTFSNLMLEQCPPGDPRHERLKLMVRETDRARTIVRQLLNFGRESVIKPVKININQPVTEITESLAAQEAFKGIELTMKLADNLPEVYADPAQVGQVVLNILLNAIHSITPPGRIEVETRLGNKCIEIAKRLGGNCIEVVFADTGKGIPEEHMHKIFDPFFSTKAATKGTGLGLAVSYGIIKKHGGEIAVESAVGKGTTFIVRLPIYG
ncbi:MAG: HAMP domain-containing protein [Nitrospirae bacterium]|nr:HAMP domain-containing protein [Nitrospirota bacterium]NTW65739.1 HAMP domain-containing protein [Nitrospirota bacterium]